MGKTILPVLCLSALAACNTSDKEQTPQKPNILLIYADDVGIGDIGAYGADRSGARIATDRLVVLG